MEFTAFDNHIDFQDGEHPAITINYRNDGTETAEKPISVFIVWHCDLLGLSEPHVVKGADANNLGIGAKQRAHLHVEVEQLSKPIFVYFVIIAGGQKSRQIAPKQFFLKWNKKPGVGKIPLNNASPEEARTLTTAFWDWFKAHPLTARFLEHGESQHEAYMRFFTELSAQEIDAIMRLRQDVRDRLPPVE